MMKNLCQEGFAIGRDRTRRLMKRLNLKVRQKRKYRVTTDSNHSLPVAANVLNREFAPSAPNRAFSYGYHLSVDSAGLDLSGGGDGSVFPTGHPAGPLIDA
ncbi:MAG: transposase [Gammaproteobacteria bacterium]|nr:transposase [Gammaproteobacteria bacterium]